MEPLGITAYRLAKDTSIPNMAVSEILRGKRRISPKVGLRLDKYFGVSEEFFIRLQNQFDIDKIKEMEGEEIDQIKAIARFL
ncbi:MAG: HigA family addiction module antidote protein [SAR324 cluster bacterium]|nr:HigA family addiction module antidote protein [SAR324 cluster bacterium]